MKKIILSLSAILFLLSGCFNMKEQTVEEKAQKGTTPVQDYVGQGFSFVDGNKSAERVKKHEEEIKQEAINYMKDTYKTDVKVNNVVPARNAAVVMIESEEPIQFHTSVIVGKVINKEDEWLARSNEGEVEKAIIGGLYAKAYEVEFRHLDTFAKKLAKENDLLGLRDEAIDKTAAEGYTSNHYFIVAMDVYYPSVYNAYLANQGISAEELRKLFQKDDPMYERVSIPMEFYSKENTLPKQKIADDLAEKLKQEKGLPKGSYDIRVYKNAIVNRVGLPEGDNVIVEEIAR
ncbi:DUF1672 family protein [Listeria sp. FSL L7-0253]|uniref:DUF1672 family protein n=1 Tax=Listeria cossartiae TaxID=2838249 RepID=UPI001625376B|nr:DUF1672 family protein [Listeria cossartiae]MBC2186180.1 DUF1672 family protein [Listeria cossartiae subsp. cossartiae]